MRWVWVLLSSLVCVACALITALWVGILPTQGMRSDDGRATRLALAADADKTRALLTSACEQDPRVERLLQELVADGFEVRRSLPDPDASRLADALAKPLSGEVGIYYTLVDQADLLSRGTSWDYKLLERATKRRVASTAGADATLVDACTRRSRARKLWVVRSKPLAQVLRDAALEPARHTVTTVERELAEMPVAAHLETLQGEILSVMPMSRTVSVDAQLLPLTLCCLFAALLGGMLGLFLTRPQPTVDESVLNTLEQAAARVAQGDLSSQIGVRFGGRADQTLNSFDRMTAELRDMREKLADAERAAAWQDMAQRIAHEIKNPLSPIRTALETLRKAHDKRLPAFDEIFDESTHAMLEEVQRMERIVREFSEFARLPKARPGAMSLSALVSETARLYTPDDVELTLALPADEAPIHADREQLTQVLVNLVTNAVHAARERSAPHVRVGVEQSEQETLLHVEDSGPGVPAADRSRIFQPYVTGKEHGTGLGLAIVRRIVSDHGGSIGVSDSELGGARFTLRLPS